MKKAIMSTIRISILFVTIITIGFSQAVYGNDKNENPIEVKFLNKVNNKPLFQLNVNNNEAGEFYIKVKDAFDNTLYIETLKGKNLGRNYLLDVEEADFMNPEFGLVFEITNIKTNKTFVYNVTRSTRVVEEFLIAKL